MKSRKTINSEIVSLTKLFKSGEINQEQTVIKFKAIIDDLAVLLDNNNVPLSTLAIFKENFYKAINKIEKINVLSLEISIEIEKNIILRKEAGLNYIY